MNDVRRLLAIKANIETAMQRDIAPHIRVFAQQQLDNIYKQIKEAHAECDKLFEQLELDQLKKRVTELEASNAELLEALEDFVIDVEGFFGFSETDDMQPEDDVAYFIGEYRKAKSLIKKEKGIKE